MTQHPTPTRWWQAIGWTLTGELLHAPDEQDTDADQLVAWLKAAGWDAERLQQRREQAQLAEQPWPTPITTELGSGLGAAQLGSLLARVRALTGLSGLHRQVHRGPKVIGPAEQRLLADRPPHHGNV